jgi:hypothetical protein
MKSTKLQTRASFRPETYDPEKHTVDLVFSTGYKGIRRGWEGSYHEELVITPEAIRLDRLNNGAPLLNAHNAWSMESQWGVVEPDSVRIENGELIGTVRFSTRPEVLPFEADVAAGIIQNCSIGYVPHVYEKVEAADEKIPTYRAVDWEPYEVSLVPIGFDPGAQTRGATTDAPDLYEVEIITRQATPTTPAETGDPTEETRNMTTENQTPQGAGTTPAPTAPVDTQARAAGVTEERTRVAGILSSVRAAKLPDTFATDLIERGVSLDQARAAIIDKWASQDGETQTRQAGAPDVRVTRDEADARQARMQDALILRVNPGAQMAPEAVTAAREFRGMDLVDMARSAIEAAGGRTSGLTKREVAVAALGLDRDLMARTGMHSTSDFPQVLASTVGRTLRQAYDFAPRTFAPFCRQTTAPDFREVARLQLSELSKLKKVNEGGEYKYMTFGDGAEKYSLSKYGGIIAITWEAIINDDLSAFDRLPRMIAEEAAALEGDIVYAILTGNPNMADGTALFASGHGNLAGAGTAITVAALTAARAAMRKQTGPGGRTLNITPQFLVVGPDKEGEANQYTSVQYVAAKSVDINPAFNTSLSVIVDPRITGNAWYLAAAPARIDTIEYAYLEGENGLFTEQRQGFEVDGLEIKARHVFAAKAIDWRGLYSNPGA